MKILITGSSGFIGSHLKEFLKLKGNEVIDFDVRENPLEDIRDIHQLQKKLKGIGGIVHLAAVSRVKTGYENPLICASINMEGTVNVLEAARNNPENPWVIFGSSREVFGNPEELPATEKTHRKPINIYGISKKAGEEFCKSYSENYGLKTRVLRFSNVYTGPNDQLDRVIPKFILRAFRGENLYINGNGEEMIFDFTYIDDVIKGIWGCVQDIQNRNDKYNDFILGTGKPISLKKLAEIIVEKAKKDVEIHYREARTYDVDKFYANPNKAMKFLNFEPQISLEEGIDLVIENFKKEGLI
ncbi:MAG: NAD-dependent epimerase/dehydratase family protein [Promethearchaeati archaeon]